MGEVYQINYHPKCYQQHQDIINFHVSKVLYCANKLADDLKKESRPLTEMEISLINVVKQLDDVQLLEIE